MSVYDLIPLSHDQPSIRFIEFVLGEDGNMRDSTIRAKMDTYKFQEPWPRRYLTPGEMKTI
jgi:hypothetical protein